MLCYVQWLSRETEGQLTQAQAVQESLLAEVGVEGRLVCVKESKSGGIIPLAPTPLPPNCHPNLKVTLLLILGTNIGRYIHFKVHFWLPLLIKVSSSQGDLFRFASSLFQKGLLALKQ